MIFYQKYLKNSVFLALYITLLLFFTQFLQNSYAKENYQDYFYNNFTVEIRKNKSGFVKKFKDWSIYKIKKEDNLQFCYAISQPISLQGDVFKRAKAYFIVYDLPYDANEIMLVSGHQYRENADIELSFGDRKFYLFAHQAKGWAYSKNDDLDIIKEMQKYNEFYVTAFSNHQKTTKDRYSLIGFKQAYFKMTEVCKI